MKKTKFLSKENFYAGRFIWKIIDDGVCISLTPKFNRNVLIIQIISIPIISIIAGLGLYKVAEMKHIIGFHYRLLMIIPCFMFFLGLIAIIINTMLEQKDIKLGSTFSYDVKTKTISLPRYNINFIKDDSIYLQLIKGSRGESERIYELNLVIDEKRRYPLLRSLNFFVYRRGRQLAQITGIRLEEYKSSGKSSYYKVTTGGR